MENVDCRALDPIACTNSVRRAAIIAGHYCLSPELSDLSHDSDAEEISFLSGAKLLHDLRSQGKDGVLVLWINDIGIDPAERERLRAEYALPENYRAILDRYALSRSDVSVMFESAMRNKASTTLRKLAKRSPETFLVVSPDDPALVRCINRATCQAEPPGRVYAVQGPDQEMLVVKEGPNPKCNLILGTFLKQVTSDYAPDIVVNIFNAIYSNRIRFGVYVSKHVLGNSTPIFNYFADGDVVTEACWHV
ncbi:hypothetical protein HUS23_12830 [Ectothiorhodospiraceae bacterium 2226]|nr:hypothetical protein HUS23_12830 [Ectothiorhodospiraceae bacterium 2226]